ncbi:MAG: hypothetical protein D3M94_05010 [Rhodocyclales bacterium GT-UBC]|nr:MAG: hypothetical protein D3M94_05010 [Rhodocyclales bacterium GT-UBC]
MSKSKDSETASAIQDAIRAKREGRSSIAEDIAELERALLIDIESFDLEAAEQRARREQLANSGAGMVDASLVFPTIVPTPQPVTPAKPAPRPTQALPILDQSGSSLLDQLRQQAEIRQRQLHSEMTERTAQNEIIDQSLKRVFFYLHDLVQQLNIVKPEIPRPYLITDERELHGLAWQEGFADYRTQSQAAGALVELVSFSYRLSSSDSLIIERDGTVVERFRTQLFDYGLQFSCKEFKNARRYVERAEFHIQPAVSVTARWRADFTQGKIVLEARNLERLGSMSYTLSPSALDKDLMEEFGRLVLGQANRFRELAKR